MAFHCPRKTNMCLQVFK